MDANSWTIVTAVLVVLGGLVLWALRKRGNEASGADSALSDQLQQAGASPEEPSLRALTHADVAEHLPKGWGQLARVPARHQGRLAPVDSLYVEGLVRGVAQAVPAFVPAGGPLFRMIGPPPAIEGLASGRLEFLLDREGKQLMSLVGPDGKFANNARVVDVTGSANGAAAAACVFQVLSVATAQYYLHSINKNLEKISDQVAEVLGKLDDQRFGKFAAARSVVMEVQSDVLSRLGEGTLPQQLSATAEFWTRMANAETSLREAIAECELDYSRQKSKLLEGLCRRQSTGEWVRERTSQKVELELWQQMTTWQETIGTLHLSALQSMVIWYQVVLTHDSLTSSSKTRDRYSLLMSFMEERRGFLNNWWMDADIFLAQEGTTLGDNVKDIASAFVEKFTVGLYNPSVETERRHRLTRDTLAQSYNSRLGELSPVLEFATATEQPQTFYLEHTDDGIEVLIAQEPEGAR